MAWLVFLILLMIFGAGAAYLWRASRRLDARDAALAGAGAGADLFRTAPEAYPATTRTNGAPPPAYQRSAAGAMLGGEAVTIESHPGPLSPVATYDRLMGAIHLLIVGETGSGKSVAANALLAGRAETDLICVIDPHATPDDWGGVPAIGAGRNYASIEAALGELLAEMGRRYDVRAKGQIDYRPLTIFVDELPAIMQHCATAKQFFGELVREARKVDMRLVCLTQSTRVKTLGIEGEGDVLENLMWLLLGEKATAASKAAADLDRPAAIDHKGRVVPVLTSALPMMAGRRILSSQVLQLSSVSVPVAATDNALLQQLCAQLDRGVPPVLAKKTDDLALGTPGTGGAEQPEPPAAPAQPATDDEAEIIRYCLTQDWSGNRIAKALGGNRQARYDQIRQIKAAMGGDDE